VLLSLVTKGLKRNAPDWQEERLQCMGEEEDDHALAALQYLLYREKLAGLALDPEIAQMIEATSEAAVRMLSNASEAASKKRLLEPTREAAHLLACLRLGFWDWDDAECRELMAERVRAEGAGMPKLSMRLGVRSWMEKPAIGPGEQLELTVAVERAHAGLPPFGGPKKMLTRGDEIVTIPETYTCLLSRQDSKDGGGTKLFAKVELDVEDTHARRVTATHKFAAPFAPGEYHIVAQLLCVSVLGVEAAASCSFSVEEEAAEEADDSDYD